MTKTEAAVGAEGDPDGDVDEAILLTDGRGTRREVNNKLKAEADSPFPHIMFCKAPPHQMLDASTFFLHFSIRGTWNGATVSVCELQHRRAPQDITSTMLAAHLLTHFRQ